MRITMHGVRGAHDGQRENREPERTRDREHDDRQAEHDDRLKHPQPGLAVDRAASEHGRHQQRADRGRAAQHAQPPRSGLEDVAREDRQQRGRAAEQHGEEIERNRAQDRRMRADERDAREQRAQRRRLQRDGRTVQPDRAVEERRQQPARGHRRVGHAGRDRVAEAAQRRPADRRDLEGAGGERRRALQRAIRRDTGQERGRGRTLERDHGAEHRDRREDLRHGQPSAEAAPGEEGSGQRFGALADLHHAAAVVAVRRVPRDEGERHGRDELHQPHQAEVERAAGQSIDLPADRDDADLVRELGDAASPEITEERPVAERAPGLPPHTTPSCRSRAIAPAS
jgi:hypothetical protein